MDTLTVSEQILIARLRDIPGEWVEYALYLLYELSEVYLFNFLQIGDGSFSADLHPLTCVPVTPEFQNIHLVA